jgi:hypothetical protein
MSDFIDDDMQLAPLDENVESVDWDAQYDAIMQEPWSNEHWDRVDWSGYEMHDQGAEALPGIG